MSRYEHRRLKHIAKEGYSVMSEKHLQRVRRLRAALPESTEKLSHGEPTFFVRKKVYAMFANNHHNDGHPAVAGRCSRQRLLASRKC